MAENAHQYHNQVANHESCGQEMHKFESLRVFILQNDTRLARMFHLPEERAELHTPFVIDEGIREESTTVTVGEDSGTQVNILSITHRSEAAQDFINAFLDAQIETSGIELV